MDDFFVALYTIVIMSAGGGFLLLRLALNQLHKLHGQALPKQDRVETIKNLTSLVLYLASLPVAYYKPILGLLLNLLVTFIWIAPELGVKHPRECDGSTRI